MHKKTEDNVGEGLITVCGLLINHFFFLALGLTLVFHSTLSLWLLSFSKFSHENCSILLVPSFSAGDGKEVFGGCPVLH